MSQRRGEFKRNNIWSNKPKPNNQRNSYDEHDDRDRAGPNEMAMRKKNGSRRVSFKTSNAHGKQNLKLRTAELGLRTHFEDDDERMVEFNGAKASTFRRRNSPIPGGARNKGKVKLIENASEWFQVNIPYGTKYDKDFLISAILKHIEREIAPSPFQTHYWKAETNKVSFFVDDYKVAKALSNADRELEMPNGFKLTIRVRNAIPPVHLSPQLRERMKLAMAKRYNAMTKALDLTKFHADPDMADIYCGLARAPIIMAAIDIISQNIPDLEALNLEGNKIYTLETLKSLFTKVPSLKILHLANNKIQAPTVLEPLRKADIVDLVLKGNPMCDRLRDESVYVRLIVLKP